MSLWPIHMSFEKQTRGLQLAHQFGSVIYGLPHALPDVILLYRAGVLASRGSTWRYVTALLPSTTPHL
jgi:hypothetical protein